MIISIYKWYHLLSFFLVKNFQFWVCVFSLTLTPSLWTDYGNAYGNSFYRNSLSPGRLLRRMGGELFLSLKNSAETKYKVLVHSGLHSLSKRRQQSVSVSSISFKRKKKWSEVRKIKILEWWCRHVIASLMYKRKLNFIEKYPESITLKITSMKYKSTLAFTMTMILNVRAKECYLCLDDQNSIQVSSCLIVIDIESLQSLTTH